MVSRQQASYTPKEERDEWRTPPYIFAWAERQWGKFDIDLAASIDNRLCVAFYSKGLSAIDTNWLNYPSIQQQEFSGWCNPPHSNINAFVMAAIENGEKGFTTIMLMPRPNGDRRDALLWEHARHVVFIVGRLRFIRPNGELAGAPEFGSVFVRFGRRYGESGGPSVSWIDRDSMKEEAGA